MLLVTQFSNEFAEAKFPGCGGAEGLRREILKVQAADRYGFPTEMATIWLAIL